MGQAGSVQVSPVIDQALIVYRDEAVLALTTEALTVFRPGFRVATARDLETAEEWIGSLDDVIVFLDSSLFANVSLEAWLDDVGLDRLRMVLLVPAEAPEITGPRDLDLVVLREPLRVPDLLAAARLVAGRDAREDNHPTRTGSIR